MISRIVAEVQPAQTRIALMEDGALAEYYVERPGKERLAGNIYKGRVVNVLPGMDAAFVDIGLERNAFLYAKDVLLNPDEFEFSFSVNPVSEKKMTIRDLVSAGQELLVQITKEPSGTKGARITTHITLPGRLIVLMPTVDYVGVSRRIEDEKQREESKERAEKLRPAGVGMIVRTVAAEASNQELSDEIEDLMKQMKSIFACSRQKTAPACIYRDNDLLTRTVREMLKDSVDELVVDDRKAYAKLRENAMQYCPHLANRIRLFPDTVDIFDYYSLEDKVDRSFSRKVWLKSGGYLIIDHTEALTAIDVNTGKYVGERDLQRTLLKTNLEAAREIAHQIRLRDIGGIIVIDFIDMLMPEDQRQVVECLKDALKADSTRTNVLGMTSLGLVEMTRKKVRQRVSAILHETCPYCNGTGRIMTAESVALKVMKEYRKLCRDTSASSFALFVHPDVGDYLKREKLPGKRAEIRRDASLHREEFRFEPILEKKTETIS